MIRLSGDTLSLSKGGPLLPKPTFFNLPQDKKDNLVNAMVDEFSRVSLYEASIANIVKQARIPRGSFYQYFKDKEDAYFYLINEKVEEKRAMFVRFLQEFEGNLFEAVTKIFKESIADNTNDPGLKFLKNTYLNMTHEIEEKFNRIFNLNGSVEQFTEINQLINTRYLNINNREELFHLVQIVSMVIYHNLIEKYAKDLPFEESVNNFSIQMKLLKSGFIKHNEIRQSV